MSDLEHISRLKHEQLAIIHEPRQESRPSSLSHACIRPPRQSLFPLVDSLYWGESVQVRDSVVQ